MIVYYKINKNTVILKKCIDNLNAQCEGFAARRSMC